MRKTLFFRISTGLVWLIGCTSTQAYEYLKGLPFEQPTQLYADKNNRFYLLYEETFYIYHRGKLKKVPFKQNLEKGPTEYKIKKRVSAVNTNGEVLSAITATYPLKQYDHATNKEVYITAETSLLEVCRPKCEILLLPGEIYGGQFEHDIDGRLFFRTLTRRGQFSYFINTD